MFQQTLHVLEQVLEIGDILVGLPSPTEGTRPRRNDHVKRAC